MWGHTSWLPEGGAPCHWGPGWEQPEHRRAATPAFLSVTAALLDWLAPATASAHTPNSDGEQQVWLHTESSRSSGWLNEYWRKPQEAVPAASLAETYRTWRFITYLDLPLNEAGTICVFWATCRNTCWGFTVCFFSCNQKGKLGLERFLFIALRSCHSRCC